MISNKNKKVTSPYLQGLWVLLVQEDKALSFVGPGKGECLAAHGAGSQVSGAGKRIFSSGSTAEAAGVCTFQRSAARILDSWRTGSGQMLLPLACPLLPAGCFPLWFSHLYPSGWCWALSLWREIVKMASAPHGTHWVFPGGRQSLTQKKKKKLCKPLTSPLCLSTHRFPILNASPGCSFSRASGMNCLCLEPSSFSLSCYCCSDYLFGPFHPLPPGLIMFSLQFCSY